MTYDPKKRPTYLGFDHNRTNPNRLTVGVMSVADQNDNKIPVVEKPPTLIEKILAVGKVIALVLATVAGSVIALHEGGLALPAAVLSLAKAILVLAVPLGIGSSGIKKKDPADPDSLK